MAPRPRRRAVHRNAGCARHTIILPRWQLRRVLLCWRHVCSTIEQRGRGPEACVSSERRTKEGCAVHTLRDCSDVISSGGSYENE